MHLAAEYSANDSDLPDEPHEGEEGMSTAIIGMGCRLPGGITSEDSLWQFLIDGRSGHSRVPPSRFNVDAFCHPDPNRPGSMVPDGGYFLDSDPRYFDNGFFHISNLEASYMDPAQRQLLEVTFEAIERAGVKMEDFQESNTGCWVGTSSIDFAVMQTKDPDLFHRYTGTGMSNSILANRITHTFNLTGPSMTIDTACSSTLTCLHLACQALQNGECDGAIVAGANLILSPEQQLVTAKAGILSPLGRCRPFDEDANGYGRAEGVGALYLKRLEDAVQCRNPVRAVVRGSAINSFGRTPGISLPSAAGHQDVIRKAYKRGKLDPQRTDYVECHGTGTAVGDPVEVEALSAVFKRSSSRPLYLGSVKSNLGHSEAVSGITGIIKATLCLEKGFICPSIGISSLNPKLELTNRNLEVLQKGHEWPSLTKNETRRASVSSFGYGGAGAHVVMEAPRASARVSNINTTNKERDIVFLLPVSANSEMSLSHLMDQYYSKDFSEQNMLDVAYTMANCRTRFPWRSFLVKSSDRADSESHGMLQKVTRDSSTRDLVYLFTGQGAQWPRMGAELLHQYSAFQSTLDRLDIELQTLKEPPSWTLKEVILADAASSKLNDVQFSQTATTALQIALIDLMSSFGVKPRYVIGHSSGEIAAAYAAGHIHASAAIKIAFLRGKAASKVSKKGAMAAVGLGPEQAEKRIRDFGLEGAVTVACLNSVESVTISGDCEAIDKAVQDLSSLGVFARKLRTGNRAYHSSHMKDVGGLYEKMLVDALGSESRGSYCEVNGEDSKKPIMISTSLGNSVEAHLTQLPAYWRTNLESPVLFSSALNLLNLSCEYHFVEIGPHAALEGPVSQMRSSRGVRRDAWPYQPTVLRTKSSAKTMLRTLGALWTQGFDIDFDQVNQVYMAKNIPAVVTSLPSYPWEHDKLLWIESRTSVEMRNRLYARDELLGTSVSSANKLSRTWRNQLRLDDAPWLKGYKINGECILSVGSYVSLILRAMRQLLDLQSRGGHNLTPCEIRDMKFGDELHLPWQGHVELVTELSPTQAHVSGCREDSWAFHVMSITGVEQTVHASGTIQTTTEASLNRARWSMLQPERIQFEEQSVDSWYEHFASIGIEYENEFRYLDRISCGSYYQRRIAIVDNSLSLDPHTKPADIALRDAHEPLSIDAMFQAGLITSMGKLPSVSRAQTPKSVDSFTIDLAAFPSGNTEIISATSASSAASKIDAIVLDSSRGGKQIVAAFEGVSMAPIPQKVRAEKETRNPVSRIHWKPDISFVQAQDSWHLLEPYFTEFIQCRVDLEDQQRSILDLHLACAIDLLAHQSIHTRIKLVSESKDDGLDALLRDILRADTPYARCEAIVWMSPADCSTSGTGIASESGAKHSGANNVIILKGNSSQLAAPAVEALQSNDILVTFSDDSDTLPESLGIVSVGAVSCSSGGKVLFVRNELGVNAEGPWNGNQPTDAKPRLPSSVIYLIHGDEGHPFEENLFSQLYSSYESGVVKLNLHDLKTTQIQPGSIVISMIELKSPFFLGEKGEEDWRMMLYMIEKPRLLLWVTSGGLIDGRSPAFGISQGLFRSVTIEQPSLRVRFIDIDLEGSQLSVSASHVMTLLAAEQSDSHTNQRLQNEREFLAKGGLVYTARVAPDEHENNQFLTRKECRVQTRAFESAKAYRLTMDDPTDLATIAYQEFAQGDNISDTEVEVEVHAVRLDVKIYRSRNGETAPKDCPQMLELTGTICGVGSSINELKVGDVVIAVVPSTLCTRTRVPDWCCIKLEDGERREEMVTITNAYATAIYTLMHMLKIQSRESILIHASAGGVSLAAIQVSQTLGAEVFATVETSEQKENLISCYGLDPNHVLDLRGCSFEEQIMVATNGQGVDAVLNSQIREFMEASLRCCAEFGRFLELDKHGASAARSIELKDMSRGVQYLACDLSDLFWSKKTTNQALWRKLLIDGVEFYRTNIKSDLKFAKIPIKVFRAADTVAAFQHCLDPSQMGEAVIRFREHDIVKILPSDSKFNTRLNEQQCFLLIGCLGGLGRSVARYMSCVGARAFVFLGRSGADKPAAQEMIRDIQSAGARVKVIAGDVTSREDICKALDAVSQLGPLGGVVQGAMSLNESALTSMSLSEWRQVIAPKVQGTMNVYQAIRARFGQENSQDERIAGNRQQENESNAPSLPFFLFLSSISGTIGFPTESNYGGANSFLDHFAHHLCQHSNFPSRAIGFSTIGQVGYLHENPEAGSMLRRRGYVPFEEEDVLLVIDQALHGMTCQGASHNLGEHKAGPRTSADGIFDGHIVAGLEHSTLTALEQSGVNDVILQDPRLQLLVSAAARLETQHGSEEKGRSNEAQPTSIAAAADAATLATANDEKKRIVSDSLFGSLAEKLGALLCMSEEGMSPSMTMTDLGVDSMLATEFRGWLWKDWGIDVSFGQLVEGDGIQLGDITSWGVEKVLGG